MKWRPPEVIIYKQLKVVSDQLSEILKIMKGGDKIEPKGYHSQHSALATKRRIEQIRRDNIVKRVG